MHYLSWHSPVQQYNFPSHMHVSLMHGVTCKSLPEHVRTFHSDSCFFHYVTLPPAKNAEGRSSAVLTTKCTEEASRAGKANKESRTMVRDWSPHTYSLATS